MITYSCADPDNFVKGGPTQIDNSFLILVDEGREEVPNTTKTGPYRAAGETIFKWYFAGMPMMWTRH